MMAGPLDTVLARLDNPRQRGDKWEARCPAHDDNKPSLGVWLGDNGAVILKCQAGCTNDDVLDALGLAWRDLFPPKQNGDRAHRTTGGQKLGPIVDRYPYVDEVGKLLFQVTRHDPKTFRQRRPDGRGGWTWNIGDTRRVLYRLPQVLAAVAKGEEVVVVEGERDVHALEAAGYVATTCPGGAGKWRDSYTAVLTGADVVVVADKDEPGRKHARTVAEAVAKVATVRCAEARVGKDVADHLAAGLTVEELELIEDRWAPGPDGDVSTGGATDCADRRAREEADVGPNPEPEEKGDRKSAATVLVEIAEELYRFGVSDGGETFAVPRTGPKVVALLRGGKKSLRAQLARQYHQRTRKAAPQQALADALLVVEGIAQEAEAEPLPLRVARHAGATWLDLGDHTGRAVRITAAGWTVKDEAPVLFKRTALNAPLPVPLAGGSLEHLWRWLNVTEADRPLVAAWLVAVLDDDMPHPILGLFGEQGTGKTTAEKVIVSALDPGPVPTRTPPRDGEAWITAAAGSWVVGVDNVSAIADWLSDAFCRAVTGDGDVRRKLYSDADHIVIAFRRCIVITGIDVGSLRGDLAERLLPVDLDRISDTDRREEREMWPDWERDHPLILGALLDLATAVKTALPSVVTKTRPRMADYARVLAAVDVVLGTDGMGRYLAKQGTLATDSLTADPFVTALDTVLVDPFTGTAAELLNLATPQVERWRAPKGWPGNARAVTQLLRRQAPPMRKAGWTVTDDGGANKSHAVTWTVARPEKVRIPDSPTSPTSPTGAQASQASNEYEPSQDDEAGFCDVCAAATWNRTAGGAWRHQACEVTS